MSTQDWVLGIIVVIAIVITAYNLYTGSGKPVNKIKNEK